MNYCCSETNCSKENNTVTCQDGTLKALNTNCNNACPFLEFENTINNMAISTNDCTEQDVNCFKSFVTFNKICKNVSSNTDSNSYFYEHCGVNGQGKICRPSINSNVNFEQCYHYAR